MRRGMIGVVRGTALLAALAVALLMVRQSTGPHWRGVFAGAEFATMSGAPWCRQGSSRIAVLRLDPSRVRIRVGNYRDLPDAHPLTITEWQHRTGAQAVFNAGQYYEDYSYMGLLVSGGRPISRRTHRGYRAALVADPPHGPRAARVIDLDREPLDPDSLTWNEVAQSFMLYDRDGALRVRASDRIANRTVVGQDRRGRLVVIASEGGYTLRDFAEMLKASALGLTHVMSMDGGHEAEMCVNAGSFRYATFGRWDNDADVASNPAGQTPLPTVIGVYSP